MPKYRLIPLHGKHGEGRFVKVSPEDFDKLSQFRWGAQSTPSGFYPIRFTRDKNGKGKAVLLHREVLPSASRIDHRDGDTLNACRENLRPATHTENMRNRVSRTGASKYKGVWFDKQRRRWRAQIRFEGRKISRNSFATEIEAAREYDELARKHFGEFARTNF